MHKTLHRVLNKKGRYWWALLTAIIFFLIVVAAVISNERTVALEHQHTDAAWSLIARPVQKGDHVIGDPTAPVELLVYGDLSCKYCKDFYEKTMPSLRSSFGSSTVFVFRHNPLEIHPQAKYEAIASECVYAQKGDGGFWKFAYAIYANPNFEQGLSSDELRSAAISVGVSGSVYETCVKSSSSAQRVDKDSLEAAVAGLTVKPSIVLKSAHRAFVVSGDFPSQLTSAISYLLAAEKGIPVSK